eukprot:COSAG05_NODE_1417_length_4940_cov_7.065895_5_plen_93_part_00
MAHKPSVELQDLGNIEDVETAAKLAKSKYDIACNERDNWLRLEQSMQSTIEGEPADSEWYDSLRTTHNKIAKRKAASPTRASSRPKRAAGSQ